MPQKARQRMRRAECHAGGARVALCAMIGRRDRVAATVPTVMFNREVHVSRLSHRLFRRQQRVEAKARAPF